MSYPVVRESLLLFALSLPAAAQETWVVDAGGYGDFRSLQAAVDAAQDGDVVVLRSTEPWGAVIDVQGKGLVIAAPYSRVGGVRLRVHAVPAGREVLIRNVGFDGAPAFGDAIQVVDCDGVVRFEGCQLVSSVAARVTRCREVMFSACSLLGISPGALAYPPPGGALRVEDALVVLDGTSVVGADGAPGWSSALACGDGEDGTPGIVCLGAARVWSSGGLIRGGVGGYGGLSASYQCANGHDAPAAWIAATARLVYRSTVFESFRIGPSTTLLGPVRRLDVTESVTSRGTVRVRCEGQSGESVFALASRETTSFVLGDEQGIYQSSPAVQGGRRLLGALDSAGRLEVDLLVPAVMDDSIERWHVQVFFVDPTTGFTRFAPKRAVLVVGERAPVAVGGTALRIDAATGPGGSGRSWAEPLAEVAEATARAWPVPGRDVELWLRAGRHVVARANGSIGDVLRVPPGVALLGGFAGDEQLAAQRDPRAHRTTLSADRAGDDGPGFTNRGDNVRGLVLLGGAEPLRASLDGLVLSGSEGATALSAESSFEVRDCEIRDNRAPVTAPIVDLRARPFARMERCRFTANRGIVLRGTGDAEQGHLDIEGCLVHANVSDRGVVVLRRGGRLIFAHATVAQNRVGAGRAALEIDAHLPSLSAETPQVWHAIIYGNVAGGAGGFGVQVALDGLHPDGVLRRTLVEGFPLPTSVQGSFDANPMFENPLGPDGVPGTGDEDLRLRAGSRAVDAGYEWLVPPFLALDLDGYPRRTDDPATLDSGLGAPPFADLGAYERAGGG